MDGYRTETNGMGVRDMETHGMEAHGMEAHGMEAHGMEAHGMEAYCKEAHGTDVHGMKAHCGRKKRLGTWIRIAVSLCAVLGWWGLFYPQLALTPDTVKVNGEGTGQRPAAEREWSFDDTLYAQLLSAGRRQIRLRSRLLTDISSFWEAFHDRDRAESK